MIKNKNSFISLKEGFKSVQKKSHYVASGIFPIIITPKNDLNLVFFNYWNNKNKIPTENLKCFIKIYDTQGNLLCHFESKISKFHNQHSIKEILKNNNLKINKIVGTVNVEIVSLEKLGYPFPAITGIYNSGNIYSSVHSAGRIKNNSEPHDVIYTEETNWTCKFDNSITPFFHYFVGNQKPKLNYITVKVLSKNKKIKKSKKILIDDINVFGSKIFFIKEIFKNSSFSNSDFISIEVEHNSVFPRLIVGNYHASKNFFEVTHSFPKITKKDHCTSNGGNYFQSKMLGYTNKDLNLKLKIFPTSCKGNFTGETFVKKFGEKKLNKTNQEIYFSQKKLESENVIRLDNDEEIKSIKLKGDKIPSRLNTSFIYNVRGCKTKYSVDIASGAHSSIFPKKITHWGHGYCAEGFNSIIMIANDNFEHSYYETFKGILNVYSNDLKTKIPVVIHPGSLLTIDISKHKKFTKLKKRKLGFFSWFLKLEKPGCECFWLSYRKKDGSIFGDHSF